MVIALLLPLASFGTEVDDGCKTLASDFATDPGALSLNHLAQLRTCVSDELEGRLDQADPGPRPVPQPRVVSPEPGAEPPPTKAPIQKPVPRR